MYVCMYVCVYVYVYIYIHNPRMFLYIYMYVYISVYIYIYVCVSMFKSKICSISYGFTCSLGRSKGLHKALKLLEVDGVATAKGGEETSPGFRSFRV